jgi:flagellin
VTVKFGSNTASQSAQRRLGESSAKLSGIYERLSSGQRINKASDDAAGLAIAEELNSKGRIYAQGIRNGNDGISLLNIADSAIDAEAQALSKEFTRIHYCPIKFE